MAVSSGFPLVGDRRSAIEIEIGIGFLVPLGWAVWELVKLRRDEAAQHSTANALPPSQPTSGELPRRAPEP
jgi:hypothetical protein